MLAILGISLAVHGLMILNDGNYWDGWLIEGFARRRNWASLSLSFDSSGLPIYKYIHWIFGAFPQVILAYRLTSFLALTLSAVLVFFISLETGWLSRSESLWLALLSLTYPAMRVPMEVAIIPYGMFYCLFLAGTLLALRAERKTGRSHWAVRGGALLCFYLSFNLNSLLVFYGGFALLLLMLVHAGRGGSLKDTVLWILPRRVDYWVLPILYWIVKKVTTSLSGVYSEYNAFRITPTGALLHIGRFLENSVYRQINEALKLLLAQPTLLLAIGMAAWVIAQRKRENTPSVGDSHRLRPARAIPFGLLALFLGMVPYLVVGHSPAYEGLNSRHAILVGLPVSLLLLAFGQAVFGQGLALKTYFLTLLMCGFCLLTMRSHLGWMARAVKDRSIIAQLAASPEHQKYSVFWVRDTLPVGGETSYKFWEWSSMFKEASGKEERIGLDVQDCTDKYLSEPYTKYFTREYHLADFDPKGPQAALTIREGAERWDDFRMSWRYQVRRFFRPDGLPEFLKEITSIAIEPASGYPGRGR